MDGFVGFAWILPFCKLQPYQNDDIPRPFHSSMALPCQPHKRHWCPCSQNRVRYRILLANKEFHYCMELWLWCLQMCLLNSPMELKMGRRLWRVKIVVVASWTLLDEAIKILDLRFFKIQDERGCSDIWLQLLWRHIQDYTNFSFNLDAHPFSANNWRKCRPWRVDDNAASNHCVPGQDLLLRQSYSSSNNYSSPTSNGNCNQKPIPRTTKQTKDTTTKAKAEQNLY